MAVNAKLNITDFLNELNLLNHCSHLLPQYLQQIIMILQWLSLLNHLAICFID